MPLLTLFTVPKGFVGDTGVIQRNAIESWTRLGPDVEVILCGDDDGTAQAALDLGVRHVPDIRRNEHGTPLLDSVFDAARQASLSPLLAYVNADIVLFDDFLNAARSLGIPVTDATEQVHAVHQNHDYRHVPAATGELWYGPEADANHALAGKTPMLSALHATHVMTSRGPRPALAPRYLRARWKTRELVDGRLERLARRAAGLYGMRSRGA